MTTSTFISPFRPSIAETTDNGLLYHIKEIQAKQMTDMSKKVQTSQDTFTIKCIQVKKNISALYQRKISIEPDIYMKSKSYRAATKTNRVRGLNSSAIPRVSLMTGCPMRR
jgi:hypothetical protein